MDTGVTDPYEPAEFYQPVELPESEDQTPVAAPVLPWWRRKAVLAGSALVATLALIGALVLAFSGTSHKQQAAIKPRIEPSYEAPPPSTPSAAPESLAGGLLGSDSATSASYDTGSSAAGSFSAPGSAFEFPAAPAFPAAQPIDWASLINPYIEAQANAQSANIASSVAGWSVGAAVGLVNSAALVLGDLILFAAYTNNNGPAILSQLAASLPAAPAAACKLSPETTTMTLSPRRNILPMMRSLSTSAPPRAPPPLQTAVANLPQLPPPPDFTGLAAAFAALPALPSLALPGVPQLPALQLPAGLPPLPTPEQVLGLASLPALGLPALPPPPPIGLPPIGLPQLPPPPDLSFLFFLPPIGLPSIGFPSIGLPSITRMLGLPF